LGVPDGHEILGTCPLRKRRRALAAGLSRRGPASRCPGVPGGPA
jgi:hypothetical protein